MKKKEEIPQILGGKRDMEFYDLEGNPLRTIAVSLETIKKGRDVSNSGRVFRLEDGVYKEMEYKLGNFAPVG